MELSLRYGQAQWNAVEMVSIKDTWLSAVGVNAKSTMATYGLMTLEHYKESNKGKNKKQNNDTNELEN